MLIVVNALGDGAFSWDCSISQQQLQLGTGAFSWDCSPLQQQPQPAMTLHAQHMQLQLNQGACCWGLC